jgi:hypothetical protein
VRALPKVDAQKQIALVLIFPNKEQLLGRFGNGLWNGPYRAWGSQVASQAFWILESEWLVFILNSISGKDKLP